MLENTSVDYLDFQSEYLQLYERQSLKVISNFKFQKSFKMITANLAGTTHLRADRHRDSSNSHSRLNLADLDSEIATAEANLNKYQAHQNGQNGTEPDTEAQKLQGIIDEFRRKRCLRDYKNWGYLACVALVLIGTIVLIVLLATGIISLEAETSGSWRKVCEKQCEKYKKVPPKIIYASAERRRVMSEKYYCFFTTTLVLVKDKCKSEWSA